MADINVIRNLRTEDGKGFTTPLVCDQCKKATTRYIHIGSKLDTFVFCKNCLTAMIHMLERDILREITGK